jgi:cysteine-rich repeat protein
VTRSLLVSVFVLVACVALLAPRAHADALADAAIKAVNDGRYCDARDLYVALHKKDPQPKFIYNAAESAYAADDRVSALSLYQELLATAPEFERAKNAKKRVGDLGKIIAKDGVGKPCPTRVPKCSDTIVDDGEQCDDGNFIDGDGCDAGCKTTACGNGVLAPPEQCDDGNSVDGDGCSATCTIVAVAPPPPPPPPPEPVSEGAPLGAVVLLSAGGGLAVTGAVVAVVGALPWLAMNQQSDRLRVIRADYPDASGEVQGALLAEALEVQGAAEAERDSWNDLGQYLWIGGVTGVAVGLAAAGAGAAWWIAAE